MRHHAARGLAAVTLALSLLGGQPARAIVGPSAEATAQASHVVMILNHQGNTAGFCSGVILAQDIVLTAAHCVPKGADLRIHYPDPGKDPVMLPVVGVARHPDYRADAIKTRERSIDLALVHLQSSLPAQFSPLGLASTAGARVGARFTVSGYGVTRENDGASSGQLRSATLVARAPLSAVLLWAEDFTKAGAGACTGDSGGLVSEEHGATLSALVLWSAGAAGRQCGSLTQSLWIAPQRPWIDRVMQAWGDAPAH